MPLTPALSAYLDFLRFFAALAVLLGHLEQDGFALSWMPLAFLSHEAVMVFFLMSGYIITSSTLGRREAGPMEYAVARLSRIYSVALPSVLFCLLLAFVLASWAPELAARIPSYESPTWANTLLSLAFLNESWSIDSRVTLNGPYWSLCYEVWYYVIFGFWFFAKGAWRWPLTLGVALLSGPAVLVLFPIWMLGAWLALNPQRLPRPGPALAWATWLLAPSLIWAISASGLDHWVKDFLHNHVPGFWRLEASQRFLTDWLIGLLLAAHLWAWGGLPQWMQQSWQRCAGLWAAWAGFSFTLYLFHRPLTTMVAKALGPAVDSVPLTLLVVALSLLVCWLIAFGTERQLPRWRRGVRRLLEAAWPQPAALRP
jgi:peptidoglycan/LPS O-acetylase OafA/YrhL